MDSYDHPLLKLATLNSYSPIVPDPALELIPLLSKRSPTGGVLTYPRRSQHYQASYKERQSR